jgi:hypothetical protein
MRPGLQLVRFQLRQDHYPFPAASSSAWPSPGPLLRTQPHADEPTETWAKLGREVLKLVTSNRERQDFIMVYDPDRRTGNALQQLDKGVLTAVPGDSGLGSSGQ